MKNPILKLINKIVLYFMIFFVVSSFLGNYFMVFDLFSHFFLQLFVCNIIALIGFIYFKDKKHIIVSSILLIFLFIFISQSNLKPIFIRNPESNGEIMFQNTNFWNNHEEEMIEYVKAKKPKILTFVEPNKELFEKIKALKMFKFTSYYEDGAKSIAFFANEETYKNDFIIKGEYPIGIFKFKDFDLLVIHPFPPLTPETYSSQKEFFREIKKILDEKNQVGRKFLLVGDFNSTFYSRVFQSNFSKYEYHPIYSWGTNTILSIPIDYAISNKSIEVQPGSKLSSDHIPLHINFK